MRSPKPQDPRSHYSRLCIDLIQKFGGRLGKDRQEVDDALSEALYAGTEHLANACNGDWGKYVDVRASHLEGARATCEVCQSLFEGALSNAKKPETVHVAPDRHLTLCGLCTCTHPKLKMLPSEEARAIFQAIDKKQPQPKTAMNCIGCQKTIDGTRELMTQAQMNVGRAMAEVAEAGVQERSKKVDKKKRP